MSAPTILNDLKTSVDISILSTDRRLDDSQQQAALRSIVEQQDVSNDDANYPHACFCPREGCTHRSSCLFFHFGQQEWTR